MQCRLERSGSLFRDLHRKVIRAVFARVSELREPLAFMADTVLHLERWLRKELTVTLVLEEREGQSLVRLEGDLNIAHAVEAKALWSKALASGKTLAVKLDSATDLDITALQLLYAARRQATSAGIGFVVEGEIPVEISAAMTDAGFEELSVSRVDL